VNETQKQLVRSTLPTLREHGKTIAHIFYENLFDAHPELRPMFTQGDQDSGIQGERLAAAILAYVGNLDRLNMLGPAVTNISRRHVILGVKPDHYPIVGYHLLGALQAVMGDAATPAILSAWAEAYGELARIMIAREEEMYQEDRQLRP
jgi:nitric oxide dioxygenase